MSEQNYNCPCSHPSQCNNGCFKAPGEIKIERKYDGSVVVTQANQFRLYDDEVLISAENFPAVFAALQTIINEIRETESL